MDFLKATRTSGLRLPLHGRKIRESPVIIGRRHQAANRIHRFLFERYHDLVWCCKDRSSRIVLPSLGCAGADGDIFEFVIHRHFPLHSFQGVRFS